MKVILGLLLSLVCAIAIAQQRTDTGAAWTQTAVTPSNTVTLVDSVGNYLCRAVYVKTGGAIVIEDRAGTQITYTVIDNTLIPFRPYRIRATGTTATGIVCWNN